MSVKSLSDSMLKKYEKVLLEEKEETLKLISDIEMAQKNGSRNSSGDLSYSIHQADLGSDTNEMERRVYLLNSEQKKLKAINYSLKKIYEKNYGICEICGQYIPEARLKIIPYARFCVKCEEKEEKLKKRNAYQTR